MYRFQWGYLFRDTIDDITNGVGPNHKCKCWKQPWLDKVCFYEIVVVTRGVWCQMISYLNWIVKCNWWLDPGRGLGSRNNTGTFNSPLLPHTVPQFWQRYCDQSAFILSVFICVAKRVGWFPCTAGKITQPLFAARINTDRIIAVNTWYSEKDPTSAFSLFLVSSSDLHFRTIRIY